MINKKIIDYIQNSRQSLITPRKNISMVFADNSLMHAILILKESNYTQIPVLDFNKKFVGLISLHQIHQSLGANFYEEFNNIENLKVKDHIDTHYAIIKQDYELEDALNLLIDYNFINVIDDNGVFIGMITRSSLLKKTNFLFHNMDKFFNEK